MTPSLQGAVQDTIDERGAGDGGHAVLRGVGRQGRGVVGRARPARAGAAPRAAATLYAALLGHVDGVRLVSSDRLAAMAAPAFSGVDRVVGVHSTWTLGYSCARLGGEDRPGSTFGMAGSNGSAAYADVDSGVAVAVMRNRIVGDWSAAAAVDRLVTAAYGA